MQPVHWERHGLGGARAAGGAMGRGKGSVEERLGQNTENKGGLGY